MELAHHIYALLELLMFLAQPSQGCFLFALAGGVLAAKTVRLPAGVTVEASSRTRLRDLAFDPLREPAAKDASLGAGQNKTASSRARKPEAKDMSLRSGAVEAKLKRVDEPERKGTSAGAEPTDAGPQGARKKQTEGASLDADPGEAERNDADDRAPERAGPRANPGAAEREQIAEAYYCRSRGAKYWDADQRHKADEAAYYLLTNPERASAF